MTAFINGHFYRTESRRFEYGTLLVGGDGLIVSFLPGKPGSLPKGTVTEDLGNRYIVPGFLDVHTHGRNGSDFLGAKGSSLPGVLSSYAAVGTVALFPTIASGPLDEMLESVRTVRRFAGIPSRIGSSVCGIHLEGRYLSERMRGIHRVELLSKPDTTELSRFLELSRGTRIHFSLAPELPGSEEFIREAVRQGATVGIAHTDADYETAMQAVSLGCISFTHTFNAARPIHHRSPGVSVASLLSENAYSEFICDGLHVHPAMLKLASKTKRPERIVLVSDSMEGAGMP
ncbi:MAG: hypothetical protein II797_05625, partial [Clostridia bacterium]|nr:hypothetical protein [Clostridia bacterium]